jgi:uncharacterized protein
MQKRRGFVLQIDRLEQPSMLGPLVCRFIGVVFSRAAARCLMIALLLLSFTPRTQAQTAALDPARIAQAPNATVGLLAGISESTDARIAADIAIVLDDADRLRILPMQGTGSIQGIADLFYLKGIDVAIVHADALTQAMQRNAISKESVQYIAKLFQEEIHVLARPTIANFGDLSGKPVSIGRVGSDAALTSGILLDALHIDADIEYNSDLQALDRLRRGEIAAMVVVGGKPVPLLQTISPGTGLHFLPVPLNAQLLETYLPSKLESQQYPSLVAMDHPVDTIAVGAVLITLATPSDTLRARRVNRFVDALFDRFDQFHQPGFHPKWSEVNLSTQLPGLARYPQVQVQLRNQDQARENRLRSDFDTFLRQTGQSSSGLVAERRQALFQDFLRWRDKHTAP